MDNRITQIHLSAGHFYGKYATCGPEGKPKVKYGSEETATKSAIAMSAKYGRELEAYPCYWCNDWHIGRAMTEQEWFDFGQVIDVAS